MRTIIRSTRFKRDYKRELKGRFGKMLPADLSAILLAIANDQALPNHYRDHALTSQWIGYRDCHIKPDLVMIYRLPNDSTLELARLGSHSQLEL
jgi:mRNA interferase YafQ